MATTDTPQSTDFIRTIIAEDLKTNKHNGKVATRFPPEPNGHLHIGHAKSICLNFGVALEYGGTCNLRFDDTNPTKENIDYVESIKRDVKWLGFDWDDREYYASDYFEQLYDYAVQLIKDGKAYVCSLSPDEIRAYRGTLTEPGRDSPYRQRSVEENLDLFARMRAGEFPEGAHVLRAKIDMASPNINMRDPTLYRILKATHHRTGESWCIYPMYDFTHCLSDALEGITHSLCTLEFEDHRPLYDWALDVLPVPSHPQQIEFARLNLTYTVMSKRKLLALVTDKYVSGWDDPRMPTLAGLRRRGYTPQSIRTFCERIGLAKRNSTVDYAMLEHCIREELNRTAPRVMAVLRPLRVIIDNYPQDRVESSTRSTTRKMPAPARDTSPFRGWSILNVRTFVKTRRVNFFVSRPAGKYACATPISSNASASSKMTPERLPKSTAPTIPRRAAAGRLPVARSKPPFTGCQPSRPSPPRFGSTIIFSPSPTRIM